MQAWEDCRFQKPSRQLKGLKSNAELVITCNQVMKPAFIIYWRNQAATIFINDEVQAIQITLKIRWS